MKGTFFLGNRKFEVREMSFGCPGPHEVPDEDWETGEPCVRKCSPHYCQADSYVEEHWRENGDGPVVFLREPCWDDETTDTVIKLF